MIRSFVSLVTGYIIGSMYPYETLRQAVQSELPLIEYKESTIYLLGYKMFRYRS